MGNKSAKTFYKYLCEKEESLSKRRNALVFQIDEDLRTISVMKRAYERNPQLFLDFYGATLNNNSIPLAITEKSIKEDIIEINSSIHSVKKNPIDYTEELINYLKGKDAVRLKVIYNHLKEKFPELVYGNLCILCRELVVKGKIHSPSFGFYTLDASEQKTKKVFVKPRVGPSIMERVADEIIKNDLTGEDNIELEGQPVPPDDISYHHYSDGSPILDEDEVMILDCSSKTDDDVIDFPEDLTDKFAIVTKQEAGSNFIKIKVNRIGPEILVYPYWIKFVKRKG